MAVVKVVTGAAKRMHQNSLRQKRLRNYLFAGVGALFGSVASLSAIVLSDLPGFFQTAAVVEKQPTRLDTAVNNAREIKAALATPIDGPAPLPPITEKLAYGYLKPGNTGRSTVVSQVPRKPKTPVSIDTSRLSSLTYVNLR